MDKKYDPSNLFIKGHTYNEWCKKDEKKCITARGHYFCKIKAVDEDLSDMSPL